MKKEKNLRLKLEELKEKENMFGAQFYLKKN